MKFTVSTLCKNGIKLAHNLVGETETGSLSTYYIGATRYAQLFNDSGRHLLPKLECASVESIQAHGMIITGLESKNSGRLYRQEWWCKLVEKEVKRLEEKATV